MPDFARRRSLPAFAVLAAGCASGADPADAESAVLAALRDSARAWNAGNLKGHLAIYDASVTVMTRNGPRPTVEAIEKSFGATYFRDGRPLQQLDFDRTVVRLLSPGSALVTGRFTLTGGGLPDQSGWFSLVWVRTPAGWRVVHDHTS